MPGCFRGAVPLPRRTCPTAAAVPAPNRGEVAQRKKMTQLSVNVNKIALLRNSRGGDYPRVKDFALRLIGLGVRGITVHPRPDERHIRRADACELGEMLRGHPAVEFNIEGYPSPDFLALVERVKPDQCTLVPDAPDQITSDHGWDIPANLDILRAATDRLRAAGIRSSLFLDPSTAMAEHAPAAGCDRVELYTEEYAAAAGGPREAEVLERYRAAAAKAVELGTGVNAGHDLNLRNLQRFLGIGNVLEVSIGHALIVECLEFGVDRVVSRYLAICEASPQRENRA